MTQERFSKEIKYRSAIAVACEMLSNKIISDSDFQKIKEYFIEKYKPFFD